MMIAKKEYARFRKYHVMILSAILVLLSCFPSYSNDFVFSEISANIFPMDEYVGYQVIDFNNNGYDELIVMYKYGYYVYSFVYDSILYGDTLGQESNGLYNIYAGFRAVDYNDDGFTDILYIEDVADAIVKLVFQSGLTGELPVDLDTLYFNSSPPDGLPKPPGNIYFGDVNNDDINDIIVTNPVFGRTDSPWDIYEYSGYVGCFTASPLDFVWKQNSSSDGSLFLDINNDGQIEIVTWGFYEQVWYYHESVIIMFPSNKLAIFNSSGTRLRWTGIPEEFAVIGGDINPIADGEELIIFRSGLSFDTSVFVPSGDYGLYSLGMRSDSLRLFWGIDADSSQDYLFTLPSLPGTFCASTASSQYTIYSGEDGTAIGTIDGLRRLKITEEGHFLPLPDTVKQVVQIDGNTVYLYQQNFSTDVNEPNANIFPDGYYLKQNSPNPFNPMTSIEYALPVRCNVMIAVYNLLGQKVNTIVDEDKLPGVHTAIWDGTDGYGNDVASGIYFYKIKAGDFVASKKMLLLK